ncbi:Cysteine desulfurase, partial [hydrothermal vent metagenome]
DILSVLRPRVYGPKGVGALYVRPEITPRPLALFDGGGQEQGLRSGTLSPALCAGLGAACDIAGQDMAADHRHISSLSQKLTAILTGELTGISLNGSATKRYPGNLNFTFDGVRGDLLIKGLRNIAVSTGSACSTMRLAPSHVLAALGLDKKQIENSIRIGIGRMTDEAEIDYAATEIITAVNHIRGLISPPTGKSF